MASVSCYKYSFGDKSREELLYIGYEAGKDILELNKPGAKLNSDNRKIIHRVLQLLEIDYVGFSDYQKCSVIYDSLKEYIKTNKENISDKTE